MKNANLLQNFLATKKDISEPALRAYETALTRFLEWVESKNIAIYLTTSDTIHQFNEFLVTKGFGESTRKGMLSKVRAFLAALPPEEQPQHEKKARAKGTRVIDGHGTKNGKLVQEFVTAFSASNQLTKMSRDCYLRDLLHFTTWLDAKGVSILKTNDQLIADFKDHIIFNKGYGTVTKSRIRTSMNKFFKYALENNIINKEIKA